MLERKFHEQKQVTYQEKIHWTTATETLDVFDQVVRATANTASNSYTIYLPPVSRAAGLIYTILVTIANAKTVTLADQDESESWSDLVFTTTNDGACVYSDGRKWWVLYELTT